MFVSTDQAVAILKNQGVVAIPTETVYGLAGRISSQKALDLIFETKKRPFFDPLIVHIRDKAQARQLVSEWSEIAEALADRFWPGPLTLVLKKNPQLISDRITSGLPRVGLRCPRHPLALEVLAKLGEAFAAPSANLFGRTSPTQAEHVEHEFQGQVPILDGGACEVGIESTVLLLEGNSLAILRKGQIREDELRLYLEKMALPHKWQESVSKSQSPGQLKHHYMPAKPLFWASQKMDAATALEKANQKLKVLPEEVEGVRLAIPSQIQQLAELRLPQDPVKTARVLYSELRRLSETSEIDGLIFFEESYHSKPEWGAIIERLHKATSAILN